MNIKHPCFSMRLAASPPGCWPSLAGLLVAVVVATGSARAGISYYVNDSATQGDVWCTAPGNDNNSGTNAASPKSSVQAVLNLGYLNSGDTVYVDTGVYTLSSDIVVSNVNATAVNRVILRGVAGATILNRGSGTPGTRCLSLRASYVMIYGFTCENADVGLFVDSSACHDALIFNNVCRYNAGPGLQVQAGTTTGAFQIANNLLYGNGNGMWLAREGTSNDRFGVSNNTVVVASGAAVAIGGNTYISTLRNNILEASGAAFCISGAVSNVYNLFASDFNDLYAHDGGGVANLTINGSNVVLNTLADWQRATVPRSGGLDLYSFTRDPAYANPASGNYHLKSKGGRWNPSGVGTQGYWTVDSDLHSPCVDVGGAGLSSDSFAAEPMPNGGRVNLGSHGGTAYASKTAPNPNRLLQAYAPDSGQASGVMQPVRWISSGQGWNSNDLVRIDYTLNGSNWMPITGGVLAKTGYYYDWTRPGNTVSNAAGCMIRVATMDLSFFSTVLLPYLGGTSGVGSGGSKTYYVNDGVTNGDVWCKQPGSDANDGFSSSTPVAGVQTILSRYTLGAGDTVLVDAGYYLLTNNLVLTNGGTSSNRVTLCGASGATIFNRNNRSLGTRCFELRASCVTIDGFTCQNAEVGLFVDAASCRDATLSGNTCCSNSGPGLHVQAGTFSNTTFQITRNLLYANGAGMNLQREASVGDSFYVTNNTVTVTNGAAIAIGGKVSASVVQNNILDISFAGCGFDSAAGTVSNLFTSNYNDLYVHDGGILATVLINGSNAVMSTLADWQRATVERNGGALDQYSFSFAPAFANPGGGDFHLRSNGGRWSPSGVGTQGVWVVDSTPQSLCIDTGYPIVDSAGAEPTPNGNRINLGADGGASYASKTPTNRLLVALVPDLGLGQQMMQPVRWFATGQAWNSTTDTVSIEYSLNGGGAWSTITSNASVSSGSFMWDRPSGSFNSVSGCTVRITANEETSATSTAFLQNRDGISDPATFYVNDTSTNNDLWCTQPGSDANNGLTPATPVASLKTILARYLLGAADSVFVDSGYYSLSSNIVIGAEHGGSSNQYVHILGAHAATVFHRESQATDAACIEVYGSKIEISGFTFQDAGVGVVVDAATCRDLVFSENVMRGNAGPGLRVTSSQNTAGLFQIDHNLLFENGSGMELEYTNKFGGDLFRVINNTVSVTGGVAVALGMNTFSSEIRNNILVASGTGVCVDIVSTYGFLSDYNDFYAHDGGSVAHVPTLYMPSALNGTLSSGDLINGGGGVLLATLADWQRYISSRGNYQDMHSIALDPLFASAANLDYHLKSKRGRLDPATGQWVTDALQSPCIDAGDPSADPAYVACEPLPNGSRLNLGVFGGTHEASKTQATRFLQVFAPDNGQYRWSPQTIAWNATGEGWQTNDTVRISFSLDAGNTWAAMPDAQTLLASDGIFSWTRPAASFDNLQGCWIRVTANRDSSVSGIATLASRLRPFYVNDSGPLGGELWCTQPGSDANDGLTPATPAASLQAILDRYSLVSRDIVFVDAGYYALTSNVTITSKHFGSSDEPVRIQGANRATVFDRRSWASGSYCVEVQGNNITISGFTFATAAVGAHLWNNGYMYMAVNILGNTFRGNSDAGIQVSSVPDAYGQFQIANNLFYNNGSGAHLGGSDVTNGCSYQVNNNTFVVWQGAAITVGNTWYGANIQNNIFEIAGATGCGLDLVGTGLSSADFNDYYVHDGGVLARDGRTGSAYRFFRTLSDWQSANNVNGWDRHSFSRDPLFAAAASGDYHLRSRGGRWLSSSAGGSGTWVTDAVQSPCVDAGSPSDLFSSEPQPNGGCINLGAYGNTAEASKAAPARTLVLSGCVMTNTPLSIKLAWTTGGRGWGSNDSVRLEFSADVGKHWYTIPGAGWLPILYSRSFDWIVSAQSNIIAAATGGASVDLRVRVICNQDAGASDVVTLTAKLPTTTRTYYVNDASLAGDLYCTAPGSPSNDGLSGSAPLESLTHVFSSNRLGAGDVVYVDTGTYTNGAASLASACYGTADRPILILGSTNGAVLDLSQYGLASGRPACLEVHGDFVRVERLTCVGGKVGISVNAASCRNAQLVNNVCFSNLNAGIEVVPHVAGGGNEYQVLQNLVYHNGSGISLRGATDNFGSRAVFVVENNTIVDNSGYGLICQNVGASGWRSTSLKNNIIHATGANTGCLLSIPGSLTYSDFNNLYATNGAAVASLQIAVGAITAYATLTNWQSSAALDLHSTSSDSRFSDPGAGNFRLRSDSPCVDAGVLSFWMNGATDLSARRRVFGASVDIGAYEMNLQVSLKLFLQGPYLSASQKMSTWLSTKGRLPLSSPYAADPRTVSLVAGGATDWVLVQFRAAADGPPIFSRSAFLRDDGQVLNDDGAPGLSLNLPPGTNYYVAVKHRNHLSALSATPVAFTNDTLSYDFTVSSDRYYGGPQAAVEVAGGVWASAAGDADGDGAILPSDLAICDSQANFTGYHRGDVDLDLYSTAASDRPFILANLGRAPGVPRPETILLPMLRITPPQTTCLQWETNTFSAAVTSSLSRAANTILGAAGGYTANWTFVTNASGATLTNWTNDTVDYVSGETAGKADVLEAWYPANDALGRASANVISTQDVALAGQVMIVAGRKSASDPLWPTTDYLTDLAYNTMRYRGFSKANIHYLNPEPDQDVDSNGSLDDISGEATHTNVYSTLATACATSDKLFLYLADHGGDSSGSGFFRLSAEETLSAADLCAWLDVLQEAHHTEVTVLLDFCYAGSFVDELRYTGTGAVQRIVVAACSSNQPSYFVAGGLVSFSDAFFSGLMLGYDVKQCFDLAQACMASYQSGQLDDDSSGLYDSAVDGAIATGYFIGPTSVASGDQPSIGEVCGNQVLTEETSATLWVSGISAPNPVDRVWCMIVPPGFNPSPENPVTDLSQLELTYDAESGRYTVTYNNFTAPGTYLVMFYARDVQGRVSMPRQCYVAQIGYDDRLVLVAGGPTTNSAWNAVDYLASLAQSTFRLRLFDRGHTRYLSPGEPRDFDRDGTNDVDALPGLAALQDTLLNWAVSNSTDRLTLYLIGTGENNTFRLNESETLDGPSLASWLDAFQTTNNVSVNVILDFDGAGAFIPALATTNPATGAPYDRIVAAACQANRQAVHENGGPVSFSQYFLSGIMAGETFGDAFTAARRAIRRVTASVRQRAELDDNGNGLPNEKNVEGDVAETVYLGSAFLTGADTPVIGAVTPLTVLPAASTSLLLWAGDVGGIQGISNVWCTITPPDYDGTAELPFCPLEWNNAHTRYEASFFGFTQPGSYFLTFYAMDNAGEISDAVQTEILRADAYEPDDDQPQTSFYFGPPQIHNFHATNDVDWVRFYAVTNFVTCDIIAEPLSSNLDLVMELYRQYPDGTLGPAELFDEEGKGEYEDAGLYPGTAEYPEGFYCVRITPYTVANESEDGLGTYEFSIELPVAAGSASLIVLGFDDVYSSALPTGSTATVTGQSPKAFSGSTAVVFSGLTNGTYMVSVPTPTNFIPREDPNTPYQIQSLTNSYYANPRQVTVSGGWILTGFEMISSVNVTSGIVRDAWTHAFLGSAQIAFTAASGSLTGTVVDGSVILTNYHTNWLSSADGRLPENIVLGACDWHLSVALAGYQTYVRNGAVSNLSAGANTDLGTAYLVPTDTNANAVADAWEALYFPGGMVATADSDNDGVDNRSEYLCGTDPTNSNSVLRIITVATGAGSASMLWSAAAGRSYQVLSVTSMLNSATAATNGPWEAAHGQATMQWTDTDVPLNKTKFYRIRLNAP